MNDKASSPDLISQILLVGNYQPDGQHSMLRYERLLSQSLKLEGVPTSVLRPQALLGGRIKHSKIEQLCRIWDKFIWFPLVLRQVTHRLVGKDGVVVHLLDQGNGVYSRCVKKLPLVITCHDLLAIKEMMGLFSPHVEGRSSIYQKRNLGALKYASWFACVSEATRNDCIGLLGARPNRCAVIPNPLDPFFAASAELLSGVLPKRYLLNVGNAGWYKNRYGTLQIYAELRKLGYEPPLVLLGGALSHGEIDAINRFGLLPHIQHINLPEDATVRSAYANAEALLFPSITEGFGWPILEAQAQGCLVFTTNKAPMTETGGKWAIYIDPDKPNYAAQILMTHLSQAPDRRRLTAARQRANTFTLERFASDHVHLYQSILADHIAALA